MILFFFLVSFIFSFADTQIQMEKYGGVYRVPCTVNGARMKFIFDTGASNVSMSMTMAEYLLDNDYINKKDFIGEGKTQTADGTIVDHIKINLREIEIGGLKLNNVEAVVLASQSAPLLLGQSAIQKLGRIQLNGDVLIISGGEGGLNKEEIEYYASLADEALLNMKYAEAAKYYSILYINDALTVYGISEYARACSGSKNYSKAIELYRELLSTDLAQAKAYDPVSAQSNLFVDLAHAYVHNNQSGLGEEYIIKGLNLADNCDYSGTKLNANMIKQVIAQSFATTLEENRNYSDAAKFYYKALGFASAKYNLSSTACWNKCISKIIPDNIKNDRTIMRMAAYYAECQWMAYLWNDQEFTYYISALARNGSEDARIFCNRNNIQYWGDIE